MITCITGSWALATTVAMNSFAAQVEANRFESVTNRQVNVTQDIKMERIVTMLENIAVSLDEVKVTLKEHGR